MSATVFAFTDRSQIELTGNDRAKFLNNFCTNDVKRLTPGQGCEAFITNVKGKIVGHVWIDATESSLWLDAAPGSSARIIPHLERYQINEDVTVTDRSADWGELLVAGEGTIELLSAVGVSVAGMEPLATVPFSGGEGNRLRRFDLGSIPAYLFILRRAPIDAVSLDQLAAGMRLGTLEDWTGWRIEAGIPEFGVDITEDNLAQEAGRSQTAISFRKGCYLGQEPIARIDALGHVNRELRSLRFEGPSLPKPGASVFADADRAQNVGTITSAGHSPQDGGPVAIVLLRASATKPGTTVYGETETGLARATVFWTPENLP